MSKNASKIEPILTITDLEAMPDDDNRYELINGEILVSRAPSIKHQIILHNIQMAIGLYLINKPNGILVPGPGIIFDEFNGVIPDLIFVTNERYKQIISGEKFYGAPDLVIEILSPGKESERRDKNIKRKLYGEKKVKEYWIVDPNNSIIEIYRLYEKGLKLISKYSDKDEIKSNVLPGFSYPIKKIF